MIGDETYMKKIIAFMLTAVMLSSNLVSVSAAAASIVSPNENLSNTERYNAEVTTEWITEGTYATDSGILANASQLFDGVTKTYVSSAENGGKYAAVTMAWQEQVQINKITLWYNRNEACTIDGYEIYVSNGNDNFAKIGYAEPTLATLTSDRLGTLTYSIPDNVYARKIKIIVHKKDGCATMQLSELAVYGGECEYQTENVNKNYHYERAEPFNTDYDMYFSDYECTQLSREDYYVTTTTVDDYISVIYQFDDFYQIDNVVVLGDGDGIEMMQSPDGNSYFTNGFASFNNRKAKIYGAAGKNAKYVKVVVHKDDEYMLGIDHISIYARKVYDSSEEVTNALEAPRFRCELKSNNLLYLDWSGYNGEANGAVRYNVYIDKETITSNNIDSKQPHDVFRNGDNTYSSSNLTDKFVSCFGLEPETEYNVAVVPIDASGNFGKFNVVKIKSYDAIGSGSLSSLFCWNDYPYQESNTTKEGINDRPAEGDGSLWNNIEKKVKLTSEMEGVSRIRWYNQTEVTHNAYGSQAGVNWLPMGFGEWMENLHHEYSDYAFESGNEPNYTDKTYADVAAELKAYHDKVTAGDDNKNVVLAPAIGAWTDNNAWGDQVGDVQYWEGLYEADPNMNDYYEVMDLHPYIQSYPYGYREGITEAKSVPEHLDTMFENIDKIREKHNIDKPVAFTEMGWASEFSGHVGNWWAEEITDEQQARYITRYYIMCTEHDYVKNIYLYAFQDAGYADIDPEYRFGIVDFWANPKPAYYSYYTMVKILKDAHFTERVSNEANSGSGLVYPNYAYRFRDETRNMNIVACWNANNDDTSLTVTSPEEITVVDSYGNTETVASGSSITINGDVKYILSHGTIGIRN